MRRMDATTTPETRDHALQLRREGYAMALYVAICLLAVLTATVHHDSPPSQGEVFRIVWGTTLGLALAHWFAFRLSSRLVREGRMHRHDIDAGVAQFAGAGVVAVLLTIPVLLLPTSSEMAVCRLLLAGFIGVIGYSVARSSGAGRGKALLYGIAELLVAAGVALAKNLLSH